MNNYCSVTKCALNASTSLNTFFNVQSSKFKVPRIAPIYIYIYIYIYILKAKDKRKSN